MNTSNKAFWKDKKFSKVHKDNLSKSKLGKKKSAATKAKIRQTWAEKIKNGFTSNCANTAVKLSHQRILAEIPALEAAGYHCIDITSVVPDIIAIKDGKIIAIEVEYGNPNYSKYDKHDYKSKFDEVRWLLRGKVANWEKLKKC